MALPTTTDIIFSSTVADRILLRRNFEYLRDRPGSKYFRNIVIRNVEWEETLQLPPNFPPEFTRRFPFDFQVEFTVLGCNAIKCYKHNYSEPCRGKDPFLINGYVFACSEACYEVFQEFNSFLVEKFNLQNINSLTRNAELPLETMSISDGHGCNYCGIQLTDLKKFALLPSSRWVDIDRDGKQRRSVEDYIDEYQHTPIRLCDMSGLVDSPPLRWFVSTQDVGFNKDYCSRFVKEYDEESDECYDREHRKVLGWIFGDNVVRMFPDSDFSGELPIHYLVSQMFFNGFRANPGYMEQLLSQPTLEQKFYTSVPDRLLGSGDVANVIKLGSVPFSVDEIAERGERLTSIIMDVIGGMVSDVGIEVAVTQSPVVVSRLLKYFAPRFLDKVFSGTGSLMPLSLRLSNLLIRSLISDVLIKTAVRALTLASSVASFVFAVTIITMIPDLVISKYNLYGFNNEVTRSHIKQRRKMLIDGMLKYLVESHQSSMSYINIVNEERNEHYTTPLITPEYIYNLCLKNFLEENPDKNVDIGIMGIDPEEHFNISMSYLQCLSVNSAGQYISYEEGDHMNNITTNIPTHKPEGERGFSRNTYESAMSSNSDVLLLALGIFFLILSILLGHVYNMINAFIITTIGSIICFSIWFTHIKPQILKTKRQMDRLVGNPLADNV